MPMNVTAVTSPELDGSADWRALLEGVDVVVHCAARVHVMHDRSADPIAEFRRVNVEGTRVLALQALAQGVRRFVFVSSIKVNGESTPIDRPFRADDVPAPADPYGISKNEAEQALRAIAAGSGLELVIVRPVLVYGPGAKGNFSALMKAVARGWVLPLGAITNARSLVALENLADLLTVCVQHPAAAGQVFLAADGDDVSTPELIRRIGKAVGRRPRLMAVPPGLLAVAASILGRAAAAQRLCQSLRVDIGNSAALLQWQPSVTMMQQLQTMVPGHSVSIDKESAS